MTSPLQSSESPKITETEFLNEEHETAQGVGPGNLFFATSEVGLLVLDDDQQICKLIENIFLRHRFRIVTIADPALMEDALKQSAFHLVILDWFIPGRDPTHTLQTVREIQTEASIIVITGRPSMDSALECLRAHIYDYVPKPFSPQELEKIVFDCLQSKGLLRLSEEALREKLGHAIRERRKNLGLTLKEMAERTNVSLGYLSQIELGKNSASIETLYRISLGLGVRVADLFLEIQPTL
ncbi:MAG: response regulator [Gemmataceae bacterium]